MSDKEYILRAQAALGFDDHLRTLNTIRGTAETKRPRTSEGREAADEARPATSA